MVVEGHYGKLSRKVIGKRGLGYWVSVVFKNEECFRNLSVIGTVSGNINGDHNFFFFF